jgi:hypothetical protein
MKLEEMEQVAKREEHIILFLPYLRLKKGHRVAGVEFVPLRDESGTVWPRLESAAAPLDKILSGHIDRHGKSLHNCVVATVPGKGWDIEKSDFPSVRWAASLLFLASWSCNSYYGFGFGHYVNSSNFRLVGQGFRGSIPGYIAISTRRRVVPAWTEATSTGSSNSVCLCRFQSGMRRPLMSDSSRRSTRPRPLAR